MILLQMQPSWTDDQRSCLRVQSVRTTIRAPVLNRTIDRVSQIQLSLDSPRPSGGVGVFEIRHVHVRPTVQCVDYHLPIHWTSNLDASPFQVQWNMPNSPIPLSDIPCFNQEAWKLSLPGFIGLNLSLSQQAFHPVPKFSTKIAAKVDSAREGITFNS